MCEKIGVRKQKNTASGGSAGSVPSKSVRFLQSKNRRIACAYAITLVAVRNSVSFCLKDLLYRGVQKIDMCLSVYPAQPFRDFLLYEIPLIDPFWCSKRTSNRQMNLNLTYLEWRITRHWFILSEHMPYLVYFFCKKYTWRKQITPGVKNVCKIFRKITIVLFLSEKHIFLSAAR